MNLFGNILWWIFGGLESAIGYFTGGIALCMTIVGIPAGIQVFKLGLLCLLPFGSSVVPSGGGAGCLYAVFNIIWLIFGGLYSCLCHLFFGALLAITIIGLPFARQHFKLAGLVLAPFGKDVIFNA